MRRRAPAKHDLSTFDNRLLDGLDEQIRNPDRTHG
jgi:hypothetical protein